MSFLFEKKDSSMSLVVKKNNFNFVNNFLHVISYDSVTILIKFIYILKRKYLNIPLNFGKISFIPSIKSLSYYIISVNK